VMVAVALWVEDAVSHLVNASTEGVVVAFEGLTQYWALHDSGVIHE
jgi:hypothetical protein